MFYFDNFKSAILPENLKGFGCLPIVIFVKTDAIFMVVRQASVVQQYEICHHH